MIANVNEQLWIDFDLDTAVFLDTIAYWLKKNASNKQPRNFKDGRYWTYATQAAFQKMFPGWKRETIRRIIRNCVKNNLLLVGNYNSKGYDRTSWFSLTAKGVEYYPALWHIMGDKPEKSDGDSLVDSNQPLVGSNPAIPTLLPTSSNNTITTNSSSNSDSDSLDSKSGNLGNQDEGYLGRPEGDEETDFSTKSGYHNNQAKNKSSLSELELVVSNSNYRIKPRTKANKAKAGKGASIDFLHGLINIYREEFPNNPQPHERVISTSLHKTLTSLVKRWPELDPDGSPLTLDMFRRYLTALKTLAPKFSLGEYETPSGNRKKNNLETFTRWNTVVKFLENQYS